MYTKTVLVSALAGLAAAAPAPAARQAGEYFTVIATHSTSPVHLSSINANGGKFWIGKETATYCPVEPASCPPGEVTALASSGGLALDVSVPGGQQAYIDPTGALSFTQAHSASIPAGSQTTGFNYTASTGSNGLGSLTFGNGTQGFFACPSGNTTTYQIFVADAGAQGADCIGIGMTTAPFEGTAAWQYT